MEPKLIVDEKNELREFRPDRSGQFSKPLRQVATFLSYIFHPLFIPVYVGWFLIYDQPYFFGEYEPFRKLVRLLQFFIMYSLFPLVTVLLLKGLGFVSSIQLRSQKERIIPYIACGLYYFWLWYVFRNQFLPEEVVAFTMAVFIASSIALIMNIYMKVSMHTVSAGVMSTYMIMLSMRIEINFGLYIALALLITGIVATSRMIVSDHTEKEIYGGLLAGCLAQAFAFWVV